jgi:hypothetical protein
MLLTPFHSEHVVSKQKDGPTEGVLLSSGESNIKARECMVRGTHACSGSSSAQRSMWLSRQPRSDSSPAAALNHIA